MEHKAENFDGAALRAKERNETKKHSFVLGRFRLIAFSFFF
jgi:hypothetical protein